MTETPVIRTARPGDLGAILALYRHLNRSDPVVPAPLARATWQRMLADEHLSIFIAEPDGSPVATCMLLLTPNLTRGARPFGTIENVVTDPAHRGRGIGRAVLRAACNAAWQANAYKVMLMTGRNDTGTLRFHEQSGFQRGKTAFKTRRP